MSSSETGNGEASKTALRVAVVGSGLAGLVAAYQLSKAGCAVTIFEKSSHPGGRAQTTTKDGYELNLGPHALYQGGHAYRFLSREGLAPAGAPTRLGRALAIYKGEPFDLPLTPEGILRTAYLGWQEKIELGFVMSKLFGLDVSKLMSVPLSEWLAANVKSLKVRQTLQCFIRLSTYCDNPEKMSTGAAVSQLLMANQGVLYLDHGWKSMIESLQKAIAERVTFEMGTAVEAVKSSEAGVEVSAKGQSINFDAAILSVPPHEVNAIVPGALDDSTISGIIPSKVACVDVCLRKLPKPDNAFALGIDESLYFSVHSRSAKLAPPGGAVIHVAHYLDSHSTASEKHEQRLYQLLDQIQPGWREELVYKRYLPNMVVSYGTPTASQAGLSGLKSPALPGHQHIHVCGDYVGRGALLADSAVKNALESVELLLKTLSESSLYKRAVQST